MIMIEFLIVLVALMIIEGLILVIFPNQIKRLFSEMIKKDLMRKIGLIELFMGIVLGIILGLGFVWVICFLIYLF